MRYREIMAEDEAGQKVWKATERKHRAMADYQAALRTNRETVAPDRRRARDQKAKAKLRSQMGAADDALRSALKNN